MLWWGGTDSGIFWVNFATSDGVSWTADKTSSELWEAFNSNRPIKMRANFGGNYEIADLFKIGESSASFQSVNITENSAYGTFSVASHIFTVSGSSATMATTSRTFTN